MQGLWSWSQKLLTVCTIGLIISLGVRGCHEPSLPSTTVGNVSRLAIKEVLARNKSKTSNALVPGVPESYVPPEASVTLTSKDPSKSITDVIDIRVKYAGLCFKPGIQATFPIGVALDAKLGFYKKYGTGISIIYSKETRQVNGALFASRHFESLDNLEAVVGYTTDRRPYFAMRLGF